MLLFYTYHECLHESSQAIAAVFIFPLPLILTLIANVIKLTPQLQQHEEQQQQQQQFSKPAQTNVV
jgi:hypothetical protein